MIGGDQEIIGRSDRLKKKRCVRQGSLWDKEAGIGIKHSSDSAASTRTLPPLILLLLLLLVLLLYTTTAAAM